MLKSNYLCTMLFFFFCFVLKMSAFQQIFIRQRHLKYLYESQTTLRFMRVPQLRRNTFGRET